MNSYNSGIGYLLFLNYWESDSKVLNLEYFCSIVTVWNVIFYAWYIDTLIYNKYCKKKSAVHKLNGYCNLILLWLNMIRKINN